MALLLAKRACLLRTTPCSNQARMARRMCKVQATSQQDVPQNVKEARAWIAAWQKRQQQDERPDLQGAVPTPNTGDVPENVREARAWIAAWQSKQAHRKTAAPTEASAAPHTSSEVARNVSPEPVSTYRQVPAPSSGRWGTRLRDGSVMFTSQQLDNIDARQAALKTVGGPTSLHTSAVQPAAPSANAAKKKTTRSRTKHE